MGAKALWTVALLIGALAASWWLLSGSDQGAVPIVAVTPNGRVVEVGVGPRGGGPKLAGVRVEEGLPGQGVLAVEQVFRDANPVEYSPQSTRFVVRDALSGRPLMARLAVGAWSGTTRPSDGRLDLAGHLAGELSASADGYLGQTVALDADGAGDLAEVLVEMWPGQVRTVFVRDSTGRGMPGVRVLGCPRNERRWAPNVSEVELGVTGADGVLETRLNGAWVIYGQLAEWASVPSELGVLSESVEVVMGPADDAYLIALELGSRLPIEGLAFKMDFEVAGTEYKFLRISDGEGLVELPFVEALTGGWVASDEWRVPFKARGVNSINDLIGVQSEVLMNRRPSVFVQLFDGAGGALVGGAQLGFVWYAEWAEEYRGAADRDLVGDEFGVYRFSLDRVPEEGLEHPSLLEIEVEGFETVRLKLAEVSRDRLAPTQVELRVATDEDGGLIRCRLACGFCGLDFEGLVKITDGDTGERLFGKFAYQGQVALDLLGSPHVVITALRSGDVLFDGYPRFQPGLECVIELSSLGRIEIADWKAGGLGLYWSGLAPYRKGSFVEQAGRLVACHLKPGEYAIGHGKQIEQVRHDAEGEGIVTRTLEAGSRLVLPNTWGVAKARVLKGRVSGMLEGLGALDVEPIYGGPWGVVQENGESSLVAADGSYQVRVGGGEASGLVLWMRLDNGKRIPIAVASDGEELHIEGAFIDLPAGPYGDGERAEYSFETVTYPFWNLFEEQRVLRSWRQGAAHRVFASSLVKRVLRRGEGIDEVADYHPGKPLVFEALEAKPKLIATD